MVGNAPRSAPQLALIHPSNDFNDGKARKRGMTFRPRQEKIKFHRFRIQKRATRWTIDLRNTHRIGAGTEQSGASNELSGLQFQTACGRQDLESAFRLLHRRYCAVGLSSAYDRRLRILPFHFWKQTQVFVAKRAEEIVGCITLITDNGENDLPIESVYPESIASLKRQGERIGEISCLAMEPGCSESSTRLFGELTRRTMFFARSAGLTRLAAVVHPRHAKFYRHAMGFEVIGGLARLAHVEGQPGLPILGTVNDPTPYRARWRQFYFDGAFPEEEIHPRPMSQIDREYFRRQAAAMPPMASATGMVA